MIVHKTLYFIPFVPFVQWVGPLLFSLSTEEEPELSEVD